MPDAPSPPPRGTIAGIITTIFSFIGDSPWKAAFIIIVVILSGMGWIIYEQREAIIENWLTPSTPTLKTDLIPDALDKLATDSEADLVQIWSIDLPGNTQQFFGARRRDGERPVIPTPRRLPIILNTSHAVHLVEILQGKPVCVDLSLLGTPLAERLAQRGMKRGCAVPIPPTGESFIGVIYMAWLEPPGERVEQVAIGVARDIARTLATR